MTSTHTSTDMKRDKNSPAWDTSKPQSFSGNFTIQVQIEDTIKNMVDEGDTLAECLAVIAEDNGCEEELILYLMGIGRPE